MSIIFGTLERLEWDNPVSAPEQVKREQATPSGERKGSNVSSLITSLVFCMALANLVLWYWSSQETNPSTHVPVAVVSQQQATIGPDTGQSTAAPAREAPASLQVIVPNGKKIVPVEFATVEEIATVSEVVVNEPATPVATNSPKSSSAAVSIKSSNPGTQATYSRPMKTQSETVRPVEARVRPAIEAAPAVDIEEIIEQARLALSRGRYQQALGLLETLDAVPETRADFWLLKGSAYLAIGQLPMAETALETAQLGAPYNAQIGVQRAILEQEKGDHAEALKVLQPLADRHQNVPEIFLNLGYSQQALGAERAAQRSFRVFLRLTVGRSLYDQQRRAIQEWLKTAPQS